MEFHEVREYIPGDDIRSIDWNVTARTGHPFVKKFVEERELTVMLLVDISASNIFGSQSQLKKDLAAEIAAVLAMSAITNNDRVGLILFTDRVERFVPPKKGRSHVMRVVTEILNANPQSEGTDLGAALDLLGGIGKRRTVAFLISDFIADGYEKPLRVVSAKHDLIPIEVVDPREDELPDVGLALVEDLESGELVEVDTSNLDVRAEYAREAQRVRAAREHLFRRLQLDHVTISTDRDFVKPLTELFRLRQRRLTGYR
jgi:uncharacterized protein (DUF58 family)